MMTWEKNTVIGTYTIQYGNNPPSGTTQEPTRPSTNTGNSSQNKPSGNNPHYTNTTSAATTNAATTNPATTEANGSTQAKSGGCSSTLTLGAGFAIIAAGAAALTLCKKRKD